VPVEDPAALQVPPARPEVARAALRQLASLQGKRHDYELDEEPGKILHEWRPAGAVGKGYPDGMVAVAPGTGSRLLIVVQLGSDRPIDRAAPDRWFRR
jgi:glycogen debranching enzyme